MLPVVVVFDGYAKLLLFIAFSAVLVNCKFHSKLTADDFDAFPIANLYFLRYIQMK